MDSSKKLSALQKLRTTVMKIASLLQRHTRFQKTARKVYRSGEKAPKMGTPLPDLMSVDYSKAIDRWVADREELHPLRLSAEQWDYLEKLCQMLEVLTKVMLQMSHANMLTLPWVLPMYEHMMKHLKTYSTDLRQPVNIQNAAKGGLLKLEMYYNKAWLCHYNTIATMLHPHLEISWFHKLGTDHAEMALIIFKNAFDQYQASAIMDLDTSSTKPNATSDVEMGFLDDICMADLDLADDEITSPIGEYD
ncbi:hypothetical protein L208DRAFT_1374683 [Tricholoma matsutake]|nr:hypothetical protein L208DRAFT_1374683 [Tricholoma matsutake 945]